MKFKLLALAALTCLSSASMAQDVKGYIGLGTGFVGTNVSNSNSSESKYETAGASQFVGGVRINKYFAVEAEYLTTGGIKLSNSEVKMSGYGASALIGAPLGNWNFFGKVGVVSLTSKLKPQYGYMLNVNDTETKTSAVVGGGVEYAFNPHAALRLSLASYEMSAGNGAVSGRVATYLVSGVFSF